MTANVDPHGVSWRRVSPRLVGVELVGGVITALVLGGVAAFLFSIDAPRWLPIVLGAAALVELVVTLVVVPRRVRAMGYQLREDDLVFRRGIMWTRVVAVPYGRMQLVDITRGPVGRMLGLADLKLVTAAAAAAIQIPGLTNADAEELRDHLVALAETRRAGL
ncbi:PH domain-containing protein [Clavibacter michiganensis]|uniref:Bacterial membrane flanked domain protein n=1 Tax=Clavibacter michiganensis TaxID=28447 RepID=A0A251YT42_9MICO|nr:PH domain-containing protein [Clavibacter michiganensis]OUE27375.1 Bacterial membrane flanked domain protein [Clavibacter michiganensis]